MTITFVDVETNGLDPNKNRLLEVACLVTDDDLNILDAGGFQRVVRYTAPEVTRLVADASSFVREMHAKTGLWSKLENGTPIGTVDRELAVYIAQFSAPRTSPVGGNSVRLDMNFMDAYLPRVSHHLDYHMRDVSSIAGFATEWLGIPWFDKASDHTAMTDVRECIRELKYYRKALLEAGRRQGWEEGADALNQFHGMKGEFDFARGTFDEPTNPYPIHPLNEGAAV